MPSQKGTPRNYASPDDLPQVGDIISSEQFAKGAWSETSARGPGGRVRINQLPRTQEHKLTEREHRVKAIETGDPDCSGYALFDMGADDPARATTRFVVTFARLAGGITAEPWIDSQPDGWCVIARPLADDNNLVRGDMPAIEFFVTEKKWYNHFVPPQDIVCHGRTLVPPEYTRDTY